MHNRTGVVISILSRQWDWSHVYNVSPHVCCRYLFSRCSIIVDLLVFTSHYYYYYYYYLLIPTWSTETLKEMRTKWEKSTKIDKSNFIVHSSLKSICASDQSFTIGHGSVFVAYWPLTTFISISVAFRYYYILLYMLLLASVSVP